MALSEKKEEDYFVAFLNSWKKVWKYKTLWFWGVVLALFEEGFSFSERKDQTEVDFFVKNLTEDQVREKISQGILWLKENWQIFSVEVFFFLVFSFLIIGLVTWIKGGLIAFWAQKRKKMFWKENWRQVWQAGRKSFWQLFKLNLFFFSMFFGLILFWLIFLGGIRIWLLFLESVFWQKVFEGLFLVTGLIVLLLEIFLFLNKFLADFLVVVLERDFKVAFWESGLILKRNSREFLKLLGMLILGLFFSQLAFEIISFLWQAFSSGVYWVFRFPFQFLSGKMNLIEGKNFVWTPAYFWLNVFVSGLYILFGLEYRVWWLEKIGIIRRQKEKREEVVGEKETELADLEIAKAAKGGEIESAK